MTTATAPVNAARSTSHVTRVLVIALLAVADFVVLQALITLWRDGVWFLVLVVGVVVIGINLVVLIPRLAPFRWLSPGLALLLLFTVAPMIYTGYIAFTNYSSEHLLTKTQAVQSLEQEVFLPEGSPTFAWTAYSSGDGGYALLLESEGGERYFAPQDAPAEESEHSVVDPPKEIEGFTRIERVQAVTQLTALSEARFGVGEEIFRITSATGAGNYQQRYTYDPDADTMHDAQTDVTYTPAGGAFRAADGTTITPAFHTFVGLDTVMRVFTNENIRTPLLRIALWTVIYAVSVVAIQFVIGLGLSLALNDFAIPRWLAKGIRSLLLLPYVIPAYLSILVWGAMFNRQLGILPRWLEQAMAIDPAWVDTPNGARTIAIIVTLWLGFPYFLLITSGALQAIPHELIEAAKIDGATAVQRFRSVVFPLLLRMIGPLTVLALAANFNNFLVVYLLREGGPAMVDSAVNAGHTDLLISFTYKLSFALGNRNDYALASVITLAIFMVLIPVVASQFKYYAVWTEED